MRDQYLEALWILLPLQILASPAFSEKRACTAFVELINFQDLVHNNDFNTCYAGRVFSSPEKLAGNQWGGS